MAGFAVTLGLSTAVLRGADANAVCWGMIQVLLVLLAAEDARSRRIPNLITAPAAVAAIGLRLAFVRSNLIGILIFGAVSFTLFLALALASRGGLGMGDVKLAGLLGLLLGAAVVPALLIGTLAGAIVSAALLARFRSRERTIAYGPYLCFGGVIVILAVHLPRLV